MSDPFQAMSERLARNTSEKFGGAYVIVPPSSPELTIEPIEVLVLDTQQDAAQFFMLLQAKIRTILERIEQEERRRMSAFGR
jgi:hypothetical protein